MFGSSSIFFYQSKSDLLINWGRIYDYLIQKSYPLSEIIIYGKAYTYFCNNPSDFDGATLVKDLYDIPGLDLDAMLHDYHYIIDNSGSNFITKWRADYIYFSENWRKK